MYRSSMQIALCSASRLDDVMAGTGKIRPRMLRAAAFPAVLLLSITAQASDPDDSIDYLSEYGATIGPEDRVSSTGAKLSQPAAMLQQDRFNVNVRRMVHSGDSPDAYFANKSHRAEIASAVIIFTDEGAKANLLYDSQPLLILAYRRKSDRKLVLVVSTSDGEPADDPDADTTDMSMPAAEIPDPFHGRWARSQNACRTGAALEILTIDARGVHQAEGEMLITSLAQDSNERSRITFDARNAGGGEEWRSTEEFHLSRDGTTIAWRQLKPARTSATELFHCGEE